MKIKLTFGATLLMGLLGSCGQPKKTSAEWEIQKNMEYDLALQDKIYANFSSLPSNATNKDNETSLQKVELGYHLYYDTRLSKNNTISCNSCHNLSTYGVDNEATSKGDDGGRGNRNSPTVLNAAFHTTQFWDGRAKDVEEQAGMPVMNPVEMAIPSEQFLVERLKGIELYQRLFSFAFPKEEQPINYNNIRLAIAAFERELITPSKFDQYISGDKTALTIQEKKGMLSFVNNNCVSCHAGPLLGGNMMQKFGVYDTYINYTHSKTEDFGLMEQTKSPFDKYMFKVPSLRNVDKTGPYFHDGSVAKLDDAVKIMGKVQLDVELSNEEVSNMVAFLKSLTGEVPERFTKAPKALTMK